MMKTAVATLFVLFLNCCLASASAQELGYGPGDKVFLSGSATVEITQSSTIELFSPQSGTLSQVGSSLKYLPNASNDEDSFLLQGENSSGLPILIAGHYENGELNLSFSFDATLPDGVVRVDAQSTTNSTNTVFAFDGSGVAKLSTPQGVYGTVVTGMFARSSFSAAFWGDWYHWFHSVGNATFPGSATNNSNEAVLIWSDLTGYYYLQPGETSASGDCVDYIYNDDLDEWYKVPGVTVGHVDIGSDGIPERPANTSGAGPYFIPPMNLDPVPQGGWIPPSSFPIPVPQICQISDW